MKIVNLEQGTPEWKRWRRDGLGGSDIANLLGLSPFEDATPEFLFREKVEGLERDTNFSMRRGTTLEPVARRQLERIMGVSYVPLCVEHDEQPWMRASLDGHNFDDFRSQIVEIKCPKYTVHDYVLSGLCPDYYAVQCQWQLLVTNAEVCIFASYNNGQKFAAKDHLAYLLLYPDAEKQAEILEKAEEFWDKVCEARMGELAGVCIHCKQSLISRPRGLCWTCYYTAGVREKYAISQSPQAARGVGASGKKSPPPTDARPGSEEKIRELQRRAEAEEFLFSPADKQLSDE